MQSNFAEVSRSAKPALGGDEIAEGLLLLRASTLKIIRLQLAMERQDRRVAFESVDDLIELDRRLQDRLTIFPVGNDQILLRHEIDAERSMLNREKLSLVSEVHRRRPQPQHEQQQQQQQRHPKDEDWLDAHEVVDEPREVGGRRLRFWLFTIAIVAAVLAASGYFLSMPETSAWLEAGGFK